ncbi:metallophosphoesterase, partial [Mannheimia haemolytica]
KPLEKPLRIGMASDLHLGKLFGSKQLDQLADIFNQEKVDLILLPGDIMDDNLVFYRSENMHDSFSKLKAPLGVYATLGN